MMVLSHEKDKDIIWWGLSIFLGLLASGIPLLTMRYGEIFSIYIIWMGNLFLIAGIMGICQPDRAWRWGITVGLCLPVVVILKIVMDSLQDPTSHTLFPLEIIIALIFAIPSSFAGVYFGSSIRMFLGKLKIKKKDGT